MGCECVKPEDLCTDEMKRTGARFPTKNKTEKLYSLESDLISNNQTSKNKNVDQKLEEENNILKNNKNNESISDISINEPEDQFSKYIFYQINKLREDPKSFIDMILNAKKKVTTDNKTGIKIYKSGVKVAINTGEEAFDNAAEILAQTPPMSKLIYNSDITVKIPDNEEDVKSKEYLKDAVSEMINNGALIKSFWKDVVKDAESCFILMIVDDSGNRAGNKRNDILNPENKYIGISSVKIGKSFACYFTLSNE